MHPLEGSCQEAILPLPPLLTTFFRGVPPGTLAPTCSRRRIPVFLRAVSAMAGDAADHRRHHAGRGDPENPPASETRRGPTPDRPSACPPGRLCLVLRLRYPSHSREVGGPWPSCVVPSSFPCLIR